jgi:acyl-coenzyme A synthetase/AMP-(fatty) acid ligase
MTLTILNDSGSPKHYEIKKELFFDKTYTNKVSYIASSSKEDNALNIFKSYFSDAKSVLFDNTNKQIAQQLKALHIQAFNEHKYQKNIFSTLDFSFLYFTSGSTGFPLGALKTKENIRAEIEVLSQLIHQHHTINKVIVTVPFIHFYGSLMGLFFPLFNNIDIVLKEHFLPNDLLNIVEKNTLVVTTPLYIKALNKINSTKNLSGAVFISSTAPLLAQDAKTFNQKFSCNVLQIFGSTETGGIAYKKDTQILWTPLKKVLASTNENNELKINSPFVSNTIFEQTLKKTDQTIQTFDYVEFHEHQFKLIGRSSQILKVAGKRYSTVHIEHILENIKGIEKALVFVNRSEDTLKDEILDITIQSKKAFLVKDIRNILQKELSNIKFSINLKIVDTILVSSMGKKLNIHH